MPSLVSTFFLLAAVWAVQRLGVRILSKSNINGPPTASFLTGGFLFASIYCLSSVLNSRSGGNLLQIIAPDSGRDFQLHLADVYGGIVRVKGLLWVSLNAARYLHQSSFSTGKFSLCERPKGSQSHPRTKPRHL